MEWVKRVSFVAGVALVGWGGVALAQQPEIDQAPPSGAAQPKSDQSALPQSKMVGQATHMTAAVEKVDLAKRELTLKDDSGTPMIMQVPEGVSRLDQVKKGDRLDLDYYESVALQLKKPGAAAAAPSESTVVERKAGKLPGGMIAREITASATVMKVHPMLNRVTIKGPGGEVDTINVNDPGLQSNLHKLKKGDQIQVTYSEAIAASMTPKEK